jgi:hypothetical protein
MVDATTRSISASVVTSLPAIVWLTEISDPSW